MAHVEPHALYEIIEDALPQLHTLTSGHTLTIHVPANLSLVLVDAKRIAQVLVNKGWSKPRRPHLD